MRLGKLHPRMYFASPVFGAGDRVDPPAPGGGGGSGLPAELQGKTPAEIVAYYQERERNLRAELAPPLPNPPAGPAPPAGPTNADFFSRPVDSTERVIQAKALTREEWDRTTASLRPSLIWLAKRQVMERHPDFSRVSAKVEEIAKQMPEWQHTDPVLWETIYTQAKGLEYDRLSAEDRTRPPVITGEPGNPGAGAAPVPQDLSQVTLPGLKPYQTAAHVVDKLGITPDQYRKSDKILQDDGMLPLTLDTRRK